MCVSRSACGTSRICSSSAASIFATKLSGIGGTVSDRCLLQTLNASGLVECGAFETGVGPSTRCSSRSTVRRIIYGARSITKGISSRVMSRRNGTKKAALKFLRKALKQHGKAETIVTDGLKSYPAAMRALGNESRREMGRWKNNRAENSHL